MASADQHLTGTTTTRHLPALLGTDGTVSVTTHPSAHGGAATIDTIVTTIVRLEAIFSAFDPTSDLVRFRSGQPGPFAPELFLVLDLARSWQRRSNGAFSPHSGAITQCWLEAAQRGCDPDPDQLATLVADLDALDYDRSTHLNLNALAKGWIVDEAVRAAHRADPSVVSVWLNLGGDLVHRGQGTLVVAIEDPRTPWDNAPPLTRVTIANRAVATSGIRRRPVIIGNRRLSHVVDPRSGNPTDEVVGSTVVADSAADADVVATILCVLSETERKSFVAELSPSTAWLVVPKNGSPQVSPNFPTDAMGT